MAKKENIRLTGIVQVKFAKEDMNFLKKLSEEKGVGLGTYIRMLVLDVLRKEKGKK